MKRFLTRAPCQYAFCRNSSNIEALPFQTKSHLIKLLNNSANKKFKAVKIREPLAENIQVNSGILKDLKFHYFKGSAIQDFNSPEQTYELQTEETGTCRQPNQPIPTLPNWRGTVEKVLENVCCYPPAVLSALMEGCGKLVYSPPAARRELLDEILRCMIEERYPVSASSYCIYLKQLSDMGLQADIIQLYADLDVLSLSLTMDTQQEMRLTEAVCKMLGKEGEVEHMQELLDGCVGRRTFLGFSDHVFGAIASAHIARGEFEELFELQSTLEHYPHLAHGHTDAQNSPYNQEVAYALARHGHTDMLLNFLRTGSRGGTLVVPRTVYNICLRLVESGNERFVSTILPEFAGLEFPHYHPMESALLPLITTDLVSRGAVRAAADLVVHGGDLFRFGSRYQRDVFANETLTNILKNMSVTQRDATQNLLVQAELRGIETGMEFEKFDFDMIDDGIVEDIDEFCEEDDERQWVQDLYIDKINKGAIIA